MEGSVWEIMFFVVIIHVSHVKTITTRALE